MATSGSVALTRITTADFIDRAIALTGKLPSTVTPENIRQSKSALFMYLSALGNKGVNLWTIKQTVFGVVPGKSTYTFPAGTIDEMNVFYRIPDFASDSTLFTSSAGGTVANLVDGDSSTSFTQASKNGNLVYDFETAQTVRYFTVMASGNRYFSFKIEYSFDNSTWRTLQTYTRNTLCGDGDWVTFMVDNPFPARYIKITELGGETISVRQLMICTGGSDRMIGRTTLDTYSSLADKNDAARQPTSFWLDRQKAAPVMNVWPVPSLMTDQIYTYYTRQVQDVGELYDELEIPDRWYQAVLENFAVKLMFAIPGTDMNRYDRLKGEALESLADVESQERDKAPMEMVPNIGVYTS